MSQRINVRFLIKYIYCHSESLVIDTVYSRSWSILTGGLALFLAKQSQQLFLVHCCTIFMKHLRLQNINQNLFVLNRSSSRGISKAWWAICSQCFCKQAPCEFCHLSCFFCQIKRTCSSPISSSERPDFAGKLCTQGRLVISHCLTAPHSTVTTKTHRCYFAETSVSQ